MEEYRIKVTKIQTDIISVKADNMHDALQIAEDLCYSGQLEIRAEPCFEVVGADRRIPNNE